MIFISVKASILNADYGVKEGEEMFVFKWEGYSAALIETAKFLMKTDIKTNIFSLPLTPE